VEVVIGSIELPEARVGWREAMRRRAISARHVLGRHSWAIGLLETRRLSGPVVMAYQDAILRSLRSDGFSVANAAHAFWLLDAFVYGQVVQESNLSRDMPDEAAGSTSSGAGEAERSAYPHLAEVADLALGSPFSFDGEFEYGLDLILDALERIRMATGEGS
jgi:hypothetical protein